MRETNYICDNPECACSFVVNAQVDRLLNPGGTPDPSLNIPLSSHIRRDVLRVVLEHADEAAHIPQFTKPVTGDLFAGVAPPG
ncbi:ogr/Delta-like zinc finger family protein [Comamonas testosteroni]|nr:ogr/Delta-like zinc finger family protein [Comamonas testosteroni]